MGVVRMPYPKNWALRNFIYDLICKGIKQYQMPPLLEEKGFNIKKSRISQIIKEFEQEEYIICRIKTVPKFYSVTKKPYPYKNKSLQISQWGSKRLRIHNQVFKYKITTKSHVTNDPKRWDRVIKMKNGVTQYEVHRN